MANMFLNALSDFWNSAGTTYTAIKMNVTNAASSATSKLIDLQVGGTSKFSVDKNGAVVAASTISTTGALLPAVSDGAALGSTTFQWSDLYVASTFTLNIGNGNWVGTHSSGIFTVSTGDLRVTTAGTNTASAVTVGGTQTLTAKTLTSPIIATITNGAATLTLPTTTDTLVGRATTDTLTNKSLTSPTITGTPTATGATWASLGTVTTITINGGSIASTPISGSTGSFTTLAASGVATLSGGGTFTGTFDGGTYTGGAFNGTLGASTPSTASVTTLTASSTVLLSPASANVNMSPTGTGTVTIAPATAGTINNVAIGGSTRAAGAFTTLGANGAVTFSSGGTLTGTFTGGTFSAPTITGSPTASGATWASLGTATTIDINGGTIDGAIIGGASAAAGTFTTFSATGVATLASQMKFTGSAFTIAADTADAADTSALWLAGGGAGSNSRGGTIIIYGNEGLVTGKIRMIPGSASPVVAIEAGSLDLSDPAAGQIIFPATQNASSDVNTLDDYEEGTITPQLRFSTLFTGMTSSTSTCSYVKVGKLVFINLNIVLTNKGSATGSANILTALPYTAASGNGSFSVRYANMTTATGLSVNNGGGGDTALFFALQTATSNDGSATQTNFNNNSEITISGCYIAAA